MKILSQTGVSANKHRSVNKHRSMNRHGAVIPFLPHYMKTCSVVICVCTLMFSHNAFTASDKNKSHKKKRSQSHKTNKSVQRGSEAPVSLWKTVIAPNPVSNVKECQLSSIEHTVFDGLSNIKIKFVFTPKHLFIVTNGNIDASYKNTGLTIKNNQKSTQYKFDDINKKTNIKFTNFTNKHIMQVVNAKSINLTLGFWPSWPKTKALTLRSKLHGFTNAYRKLIRCKVKKGSNDS